MTDRAPLHDLLMHSLTGPIDMISPLSRRECFDLHPFYEDLFAEGEAVFFRIALSHWFHHIPEPLAVNRDTGSNAGKALKRNHDILFQALERLERHELFPRGEQAALDRFRQRLRRAYGWQAVRVGADMRWARKQLLASIAGEPRQAMHPKFVGGMAISLLPAPSRRHLNELGTRLRQAPGNASSVEDFPGDVF